MGRRHDLLCARAGSQRGLSTSAVRRCPYRGHPWTLAGVRVVDFPDLIVPDLRGHLDWLPPTASLVFASSAGSPLSHSNFRNRVWLPALAVVGLERIHFHGLRDTGNQLIANAGAKRGTYRLGEGPSSPARP